MSSDCESMTDNRKKVTENRVRLLKFNLNESIIESPSYELLKSFTTDSDTYTYIEHNSTEQSNNIQLVELNGETTPTIDGKYITCIISIIVLILNG